MHRWGHNERDIDLTWRYLKLAKRFRDEQISALFQDFFQQFPLDGANFSQQPMR